MIFVAYASYFVYEWFFSGRNSQSNAPASPRNSLIGLFIFGLPALWYTIFGRISLRKTEKGNDGA
jgi:hypothetical protein